MDPVMFSSGILGPAIDENDLVQLPSGIIPTIQNVVATANLGSKLELKEIAMAVRNAEYNPRRFQAVIMRIKELKTTALIFSSGKLVCTGAKSEKLCNLAVRKFTRIIQKVPTALKNGADEVRMCDFKIQNMVASADVKFPIRLEGLAYSHSSFVTYEPELFPGLVYRMKDPKVTLLIFVSGKVVITGAKHKEHIYEAFENIWDTSRRLAHITLEGNLKWSLVITMFSKPT